MTASAVEPEAIEFAPLPAEANFDTAFDADHKAHAQLQEKRKQRLVCKSAIRREPDATRFDVLKDQFERPFDHGALIQMHPTFELSAFPDVAGGFQLKPNGLARDVDLRQHSERHRQSGATPAHSTPAQDSGRKFDQRAKHLLPAT